ncbi:MAG: hypothetical protein HPY59_10280 [Anaerolineae bacterium]|nr:hypothetical protein [Anaerolineae bacterium]
MYWGTPALQFIPWRGVAWEMLSSGILPLWNPFNGMGAPLLANYQLALFYPPGWALFIFYAVGGYPWLAWGYTFFVALHLVWAGIGVCKVVKDMGCGELACLVSALAFSLSGYFVSRAAFFSILWTGAWLPWVIFFTRRIPRTILPDKRIFHVQPGLVLSVTFMLLAGHAQLSWYIILLAFSWLCFEAFSTSKIKTGAICVLQFVLACLFAAGLSAIQLAPTFEYLQQSQRSSAVGMLEGLSYSLWPWRLITLLAPDFFGNPGLGDYWGYGNFWEDSIYIGVLPFLLAVSTIPLVIFKRQRRSLSNPGLIVYLWSLVLVSIILALGKFTPVFIFLYKYVPTFDMFNAPARIMVVAEFCFAILAGIGVEHWARPAGRGLYWLRLATAGGFAITLGAILSLFVLQAAELTFIRSAALAGVWALATGAATLTKPDAAERKRMIYWKVCVVLLVGTDLVFSMWNIIPVVDMSFYQARIQESQQLKASVGSGRLFIRPRDEYQVKFFRFLRFKDFRPIEPLENMRRVMLPNLNLMDEIPSANNFDPLLPARYAHWMETIDDFSEEEIIPWLRKMGVSLYEVYWPYDRSGVKFLPIEGAERIRWAPCSIVAQGEIEAFTVLKNGISESDSNQTVIIEAGGDILEPKPCLAGRATLRIVQENPLRMDISVDSETPGWLIVSDVWYPGWVSFLDGDQTKLYRGDYLFRAVQLPAGQHLVTLQYIPKSFEFGCILSLASGVGLIILMVGHRKKMII